MRRMMIYKIGLCFCLGLFSLEINSPTFAQESHTTNTTHGQYAIDGELSVDGGKEINKYINSLVHSNSAHEIEFDLTISQEKPRIGALVYNDGRRSGFLPYRSSEEREIAMQHVQKRGVKPQAIQDVPVQEEDIKQLSRHVRAQFARPGGRVNYYRYDQHALQKIGTHRIPRAQPHSMQSASSRMFRTPPPRR